MHRISRLKINEETDGLQPFEMNSLRDIVMLTGPNGSGKSRLLKLIDRYMTASAAKSASAPESAYLKNVEIDISNAGDVVCVPFPDITIINYSHYDIPLQAPNSFSPYMLSTAKERLQECDFEKTAYDALLFMKSLCEYEANCDELKKFNKLLKLFLGEHAALNLNAGKQPQLFGRELDDIRLSPGQQYLLRMCVALHCNVVLGKPYIFLLDEPETHLHPSALVQLIEELQKKDNFGRGQIWIATHSVALLSMQNHMDIWHMDLGEAKKMGSNSESIVSGLIGGELQRYQLQQFMVLPDVFACNAFAAECLKPQPSIEFKSGDKQNKQIAENLSEECIIVDFGAGKGRLLEGIGMDFPELLSQIDYYAYNIDKKDSEECLKVMRRRKKDKKQYFTSIESLKASLDRKGLADFVFMVNVLHEIQPSEWVETFNGVKSLLKTDGHLVVVENEELTYGEKSYDNGFLVVPEEALRLLESEDSKCTIKKSVFGENTAGKKENLVKYEIPARLLGNIDDDVVKEMVSTIRDLAFKKVKEMRDSDDTANDNKMELFKKGIKLAFWSAEYINAQLIIAPG
jgi:predicted ATPase